jgi:hypothetical protein
MTQRIKIGNVYVEVPEGTAASAKLDAPPHSYEATKSDTPEPMEEQPYLYQPNDPFRASLDQAHAVTSIDSSHKPWVRKTWFALFVVGPLFYAQAFAFAIAYHGDRSKSLWVFLAINAFILPIWLIYFTIWRRNVRRHAKTAGK